MALNASPRVGLTAESKRPWGVNGTSAAGILPSLGPLGKMGLGVEKSQKLLRTVAEHCFLSFLWPHIQNLQKFQHGLGGGGAHEAPLLAEELLAVAGCQGRSVSFLLGHS